MGPRPVPTPDLKICDPKSVIGVLHNNEGTEPVVNTALPYMLTLPQMPLTQETTREILAPGMGRSASQPPPMDDTEFIRLGAYVQASHHGTPQPPARRMERSMSPQICAQAS